MKYFKLFLKKLLRYVLKPLSFLPALMMMFVIFNFSAQDGTASSSVSSSVSVRFVQVCDSVLDREWSDAQIAHYAERIEHYVRKLAHVTEYFLLAVAVSFPLYVYRLRGWRLVLAAGLFCVCFAGLDEWHQSFVPGRSPSPRDVAIDSIGIFAGIELTRLICFIGRKTIFRPLSIDGRKEEEERQDDGEDSFRERRDYRETLSDRGKRGSDPAYTRRYTGELPIVK
ncbi:VanZ family protein [Eisenbergiella sp.]